MFHNVVYNIFHEKAHEKNLTGEWTAEWDVQGATMQDYKRFAKAMLDVYEHATFGWAYWSYKNQNNHWSLKWMIENNYIKL